MITTSTLLDVLASRSAQFKLLRNHPDDPNCMCWNYEITAPLSLDDLAQVTVSVVWDEGDEPDVYIIPLLPMSVRLPDAKV